MKGSSWFSEVCTGLCEEKGSWKDLQKLAVRALAEGTDAAFEELSGLGAHLERVAAQAIRKAEELFASLAYRLTCVDKKKCDEIWLAQKGELWDAIKSVFGSLQKYEDEGS